MKKFLILLSLFFVTVCYAAPPPDAGAGADLQSVPQYDTQDVLNVVIDVPETGIEAQEVAFAYIGDIEIAAGTELNAEPVTDIGVADIPAILITPEVEEMNKPPSYNSICGAINNHWKIRTNRQHSNYGYPFTAN
ncbi:MAG: hypothetical protein ACOCVA_03375 [Prolixibacteraceae bacterium]